MESFFREIFSLMYRETLDHISKVNAIAVRFSQGPLNLVVVQTLFLYFNQQL